MVPGKTVLLFHMRIHQLWAINVFLVIIPAYMQLRDLGILNITEWGIFLPETIIVGMIHKIIPGRNLIVKIFFVYIFQRPQPKVPVKKIKFLKWKIAVCCLVEFNFIGIFHAIAETESTVMVEIITTKKISHTGLFRGGFECRMRIDSSDKGQPSGIGNANNAGLT